MKIIKMKRRKNNKYSKEQFENLLNAEMLVGGVDRSGKDATNDLTFLVLEARNHTRLISPWMAVRLHKNTPYELKLVTANSIRMGTGEPKIFNDEVAIKTMLNKGTALGDANDYCVVGCVELDAAGKHSAYARIMDAVANYDVGNTTLAAVLDDLTQ